MDWNRGYDKVELLKVYGVDFVVDFKDGGFINIVKVFLKFWKFRGVDVFYDLVGGKFFKDSMKFLSWGVYIVIIGFMSGEIFSIFVNILFVKVCFLILDECYGGLKVFCNII